MRPIATDKVAWSVCLFVCLLQNTAELIEVANVWADSRGPKKPLLDGVEIPHGKGQFFGDCPANEKHWESRLRCKQQKRSFQRQ